MGKGKSLEPEKIDEIRRLRAAGMSYASIGREVGVSDVTAARYSGDVEINTSAYVESGVCCEKCGEPLPKRAKFCFMCGTKIMSEGEKLALRVSTLRRIYSMLPEGMRDETISVLNDVVAYLDKEGKENDG